MTGYYVLSTTEDEQVVFTLFTDDSEVALTSDPYCTKAQAMDGIELMRAQATKHANFQREQSSAGDPFFVVEDADGEVIACSELHHSTNAMERAIQCVMDNAASETVRDLT